MEIILHSTAEGASKLGAKIIARLIEAKPNCVLGLATGRTPLRLYRELIELHQHKGLNFSQVKTFNLDEYVGLPAEHPQSYHHFMRTELFQHININLDNTHLPDGNVEDLRRECVEYEKKIETVGGIDLQVLGLGSNGHIGFNEPTGSLGSHTWVKILSQQTRRDNSELFSNPDEIPRHCITMGIGTIMKAKHCLLLAFGASKAKAVEAMIEGPVTSMCPASALQFHPRVTIVLDEAAACALSNLDHYRWVNSNKLDWQKYD